MLGCNVRRRASTGLLSFSLLAPDYTVLHNSLLSHSSSIGEFLVKVWLSGDRRAPSTIQPSRSIHDIIGKYFHDCRPLFCK
ncbi:uncharacterized protein LAESUDRAFT_725946 [Laetiporus sulphureus 93-53]|uniref:Uncharacterized protein n=1 Tax=Laetiporus sulphureus 93-53 TaxID=1314785 RepID=A0A165E8Z6_9APHY|nr:uncharacterized protein LAESUDRAFT_725946 [Laetiporus sulphureus 93-53]KZT06496.1 hypothetical protein LAESUDRAFT_725946 [Laetiporus sulphureus 93-53]